MLGSIYEMLIRLPRRYRIDWTQSTNDKSIVGDVSFKN